jgi:hypothetical protein
MEKIDDQFELSDMGSQLLDELATGLYDPGEVIREYVQNAVDSHRLWKVKHGVDPEGPVQIELNDDGSLTILDYGIGMNKEEILEVKSIAVSNKDENEATQTGYKGVGIWAGLSSFNKIRITSTKRGVGKKFTLEIDFEGITNSVGQGNMAEVLNPNYTAYVDSGNESEHYTDVELIQPTKNKSFFQNDKKVRTAVRENCPCRLDSSTFGYHDKINQWYDNNGFEFFEISVNGKEVTRSYSSDIRGPIFEQITVDDKVVAKLWRAFTDSIGMMESEDNRLVGYRIFSKGFVIGGKNPYGKEEMKGFQDINVDSYLDWQVGEIFIVDNDISPKLQRDELESTPKSNSFIRLLRDKYEESAWRARTIAYVIKFENQQEEAEEMLESFDGESEDGHTDKAESYYKDLSEREEKWMDYKGQQLTKSKTKIKAIREDHVKMNRRKLIGEFEQKFKKLGDGKDSDSEKVPETPETSNGSADPNGQSPTDGNDDPDDPGGDSPEQSGDAQPPTRNTPATRDPGTSDDVKMIPLNVVVERVQDVLTSVMSREKAEDITSKIHQYLSRI